MKKITLNLIDLNTHDVKYRIKLCRDGVCGLINNSNTLISYVSNICYDFTVYDDVLYSDMHQLYTLHDGGDWEFGEYSVDLYIIHATPHIVFKHNTNNTTNTYELNKLYFKPVVNNDTVDVDLYCSLHDVCTFDVSDDFIIENNFLITQSDVNIFIDYLSDIDVISVDNDKVNKMLINALSDDYIIEICQ